MRFEYILIILLALFYYILVIKEEEKDMKLKLNKDKHLKVGSTVRLQSGIIGVVEKLYADRLIIKTGEEGCYSFIETTVESVKYVMKD